MGNFQKIKYGGFLLAIFFCIHILLLIIVDFFPEVFFDSAIKRNEFLIETVPIIKLTSYIIGFFGTLFIYSANMIDDLTGSALNKALIAKRIGRQKAKRLILIFLGVMFVIIAVYFLYLYFN